VSLALYGTQECHIELCACAVLESALHHIWYDQDHNQYCAPFKNDPGVTCPSYCALCASVTKPSEYVDVMCILALSTVTGVPMQSYFLPLAAYFSTKPLTRCTAGHAVTGSTKRKVCVMWTQEWTCSMQGFS